MTHPDDLLADYVDGALSAEDLRRVERHLASCERCSSEIVLAAGARRALATLVEPPVPARVGGRAIEETGREAGTGTVAGIRSRPAAPVWYRWAIGAAAAAALLVTVLALPHLGGGPDTRAAAPGVESDADSPAGGADAVEIQHHDYDASDVTKLALSYRSTAPTPATAQGSAVEGAFGQDQAPAAVSRELTPDATACLNTAVPNSGGELIRLIRARFEGTPAFFGVYLEGPGAGQPPDTVRVWVVSVRGCTILTYTGASI